MKKAKYTTPEMRVRKIAARQIICTSGKKMNSLSNSIDLDYEGEAPEDIVIR